LCGKKFFVPLLGLDASQNKPQEELTQDVVSVASKMVDAVHHFILSVEATRELLVALLVASSYRVIVIDNCSWLDSAL